MQGPVGDLLRNYVFEYHSFQISCDLFLQIFMNKLGKKESSISTPSPRKSFGDSFFRSSTFTNWTLQKSTTKSISQKKKRLRSFSHKKKSSYRAIYQRKKSVESETWKKSTKLFDKIDSRMQSFSIFTEKSQSFTAEQYKKNDFKFKYANYNELLKIRQKHLALCSRANK